MLKCVNPFGLLQDFLADCFYNYGLFISRFPRVFALCPLVLTCIFSLWVLNFRMEVGSAPSLSNRLRMTSASSIRPNIPNPESSTRFTDASPATPRTSKSLPSSILNESSSFVSITIESKNGREKNLLDKERGAQIVQFNKFVLNNLTLDVGGTTLNFGRDVCPGLMQCTLSNTIVEIFYNSFWSKRVGSPSIGRRLSSYGPSPGSSSTTPR